MQLEGDRWNDRVLLADLADWLQIAAGDLHVKRDFMTPRG